MKSTNIDSENFAPDENPDAIAARARFEGFHARRGHIERTVAQIMGDKAFDISADGVIDRELKARAILEGLVRQLDGQRWEAADQLVLLAARIAARWADGRLK